MKQQETNKSNTDTNVLQVKKSNWYKEACLIETDTQVLCRVYKHDFDNDEEAEKKADLICKAVNNYQSLIDALKEFLKVINRTDTALYYYGDAIKKAENAIANTEK